MAKERYIHILKTSIVGIVVNILLAMFKAGIGLLAHSIAITMDAVNNLTDAISSIITIIGIHLSGRDPDKAHPFGHGRTEYLSTLAIAIIITYAGVTAAIESVKSIISHEAPDYKGIMLVIIGVTVLAKIGLGLYFTKKGKETSSDSLSASGKDALFDAVISTITIIAAIVYMLTGVSLEAILGLLISALIIKSGLEILKETVSKLLGEGASVELVKKIKQTIVSHEGVNGAYDLIFNNYGQDIYMASVHIEVPSNLNANEIDLLSRHIVEDVYREHGVQLTAIGVYSDNASDETVLNMKKKVTEIATSHQYVNQIHGFYADLQKKVMRFDMVISFDAKSRADLYMHVMEDLKREFPDFEIGAGMDADFNEIED